MSPASRDAERMPAGIAQQRPTFVSNPPAVWNQQPTPSENIGHGNPQQINKCQEQTKPKCSKQPNESNDQQGEERGFQLLDGNEPQDRWQETAGGWSAPALLLAAARAERRRRAGEMEAAGSPREKRTVAVGGLPYLRRAAAVSWPGVQGISGPPRCPRWAH
jgi:hypothetical protein